MKLIILTISVCCVLETQTSALFPNRFLRKVKGTNDLLGRNERLVNWHRKDHHNKDHLAMKTQAQITNTMAKKQDNKIKQETFTCTDILGDTLEWSPDEPQMFKVVYFHLRSLSFILIIFYFRWYFITREVFYQAVRKAVSLAFNLAVVKQLHQLNQ